MRVGTVSETCPPEIHASAVAGLALGLADARHGAPTIRPHRHCGGPLAGRIRGIEMLQARSAT